MSERRDQLILSAEQGAALARLAQALLDVGLEPAVTGFLEAENFPDENADRRYHTAAIMTVLDALCFMVIAANVAPQDRLAAAREHARNVRRNLKDYHADTGR